MKSPKAKRFKLPSRKSMVRRLDAAFSLIIRMRDKHRCVLCGSTQNPTCGHVFSRSAYGTRWDDRNAFCQCAGCNMRHEFNAYPFIRYATAHHGQAVMDDLQRLWNKPSNINNSMMYEMMLTLENKVQASDLLRAVKSSHEIDKVGRAKVGGRAKGQSN